MQFMGFKGGIHPIENKELSKHGSLKYVPPKGEFVFPLAGHIGAPAVSIVNVGDTVKKGQKIADASGFVSSPIYSSVDGVVKDIEERLLPTGAKSTSIIIGDVTDNSEILKMETKSSLDEWSVDDIVTRIKEAGIIGLGGAGFPTHVKLSPKEREKIDYIIINGAECEPYLTTDYRRMIENSDELVLAGEILLKLFENAKVVFAIEDNKKDCIKLLKSKTDNKDRIEVFKLHTKYPQGSERQLIYAVTRRDINSSMLPSDVNVIVDNIETIYNIEEAVLKGIPYIYRTMTISGEYVNSPSNLIVPIGMNQEEVLNFAGGTKENASSLSYVSGGPMMGFTMYDLNVPVTKTSSALLAIKEPSITPTPCISCGRCVEVCPSRLIPSKLAKLADNNLKEEFDKLNGAECVECGCCSYVCPAKKHLKQSIAMMRKEVLADRKKK